jgi:phospholipid/cholesterol/gamma-HCH transport system substrate-binding protein
MATRQSVSWIELRVGVLVLASFVLLAAAIFFVGGETGFFTPTYTVTSYFESANGMNTGAEVWLEGVTVGNVRSVSLSNLPDPERSVAVEMGIDQQFQDLILSDALVTVQTIGLLGDSYVDIARGVGAGDPVPDGGTIQGQGAGDIRELITGTNDIIANLGILSDRVQQIATQIQEGEGTLGRFLTDTAVFDNANDIVLEASQLVRDVRTGDGTIGRLVTDDTLFTRITEAVERLEGVIADVDSGEGALGRFIRDPSIYDQASELVLKAGNVVDRLERGEGTLGRLSQDDTLFVEARTAMEGISAMVSNVANSEGTAGRLINDPSLYNNVNQTVSEMLKLVYDFRQDPGRFLTINFRLF